VKKRIRRKAKLGEEFHELSKQIKNLYDKKRGVYAVAQRKKLQATNLYKPIYACDTALFKIRKVLWRVDHDLKWEIIEKPKQKSPKKEAPKKEAPKKEVSKTK
jgi:hypothetical protein